jgi:hypothetical protein
VRRRSNVSFVGEVVEERLDLERAHLSRMAPAVEADVSTNPPHVSLLGPVAEMAVADALANDFEQAWRSGAGRAVRVAGRRGACQRASADDAVVARCVHIRPPRAARREFRRFVRDLPLTRPDYAA